MEYHAAFVYSTDNNSPFPGDTDHCSYFAICHAKPHVAINTVTIIKTRFISNPPIKTGGHGSLRALLR